MKRGFDLPALPGTGGFTLIECLVYLGVVTVVLGMASATCWRCWDAQRAIRRDAEEIARALRAGEQWRADVRSATGPIGQMNVAGAEGLRIPTARGNIEYALAHGELRRRVAAAGRAVVVLAEVQFSRMQPDRRQRLTAWRWELDLEPGPRKPELHPRFTFEAVPGFAVGP